MVSSEWFDSDLGLATPSAMSGSRLGALDRAVLAVKYSNVELQIDFARQVGERCCAVCLAARGADL